MQGAGSHGPPRIFPETFDNPDRTKENGAILPLSGSMREGPRPLHPRTLWTISFLHGLAVRTLAGRGWSAPDGGVAAAEQDLG